MNKRFIILLHILFFSIPILLGNMISAEGQGKTIEEAKLNARVELASQFSMTISSEQWLIIKDSNSSSETKETFLENTKTEVNIELLGVKFDNQKVNNSQFSVTAYLDDSSTSIYVEKLKILKKSIEEIETSISSDVQIDFLKHKFAFLISYYEQFEIYSTIALIMDPNLDLPTLTKTKAGAELALLNLLKKENIELEEKLRDSITRDLTSSQLQSTENELLIEMEIAAQKLKSNQQILQEYEKAEKIRADNLQRLTNEKIKEAVFLMNNKAKDELQNISRIVDSIDPAELISRIEQKKQSYSKIRSELINHINQQSVTINTRFDNLINEVELRSYRTAELSNGKPTNEAKKVRENEIYNLEKMRDLEIEQMVKELNSSQVAIMDDLLKSIINDYKLLENSTYYVQSGIDNISVNIGSYDGYRKSWPVAFSVDILQKEIFQDIYLPYENITKSKLPSFSITEKNKNAYSTYLDNVDLFEMFFSTADNPLSLKITIIFSKEMGLLNITSTLLKVISLDQIFMKKSTHSILVTHLLIQ